VLSAVALLAPVKWPKSSSPLVIIVVLLGVLTLGMGGYIAYAGGKIRHREFRNGPPPPKERTEQAR
jgi:flagellar basal body-associated protein FliL